MITDGLVLKRIRENNITDEATLFRLEAKLKEPRFLDEAPKIITLKSNTGSLVPGGVEEELKKHFFRLVDMNKASEVATLDMAFMGRGTKHCDYFVWLALKTLMFLGCSRYEQQAMACRGIFMTILTIDKEHITIQDMFDRLYNLYTETDSCYVQKIIKGLGLCIRERNEIVYIYLKNNMDVYGTDFTNKYIKDALDVFGDSTPTEIEAYLKRWVRRNKKKISGEYNKEDDLKYYCELELSSSER